MSTEKNRREISGLVAEKWANLGTCISHAENKTVFVKGAIPGETVLIRTDKENSKLIWGTVVSTEKNSTLRIESDCSAFPECGGCSYRHIPYQEELQIKKSLLQDSFLYVSKLDPSQIPEIKILSGPSNGYRNTAQIKIEFKKGKTNAGFYKENSNSLVLFPKEGCKHLPSEMNEYVRKNLGNKKTFSRKGDWRLRYSSGEILEYDKKEVKIGPYLPEKIEWSIPAEGFTQVNRFLLEEWMLKIRTWIPKDCGPVLEFYSGAGLISLAIGHLVSRLSGYELSNSSVKAAEKNAKNVGYSHLEFHTLDLNSSLPKKLDSFGAKLCILNPPRAGASSSLLDFLDGSRPSRVIYSSCNPSTLARDLGTLKNSGYKPKEIVLTDFFPRTKHFEVLVLLDL
ncbi:tRNA (uracil-5-)-methyltransferase [Leptospira hartskeerlii]|uniref:tRNA (Uracil-5-)-methyltransferase n=1 Tax=Leptospira hartskeerlii TaxID=2023177 RepID=A0A2M9XHE4_9LEPT|nr:class I SAM-dependent RNA methyltransferase [Leptospira hartskeerlii]PJZ27080.1 tRNA (uracil-5-)-methyltransferase [Leptospira hartskeerlii]PJZ33739.1 tRNA (uracil-5-)-methyltransferase [Leptospira hartskeerlii]